MLLKDKLAFKKNTTTIVIILFFYAPLEVEAFGGEVIYAEDGPPNSGQPFISDIEKIAQLEPPKISESKMLHKVLHTIEKLKEKAGSEIPIIGVAMSPFSLPVMQLGFEKYLDSMHFRKDLFEHLMKVNEEFCVDWSNAQLEAGATAICFYDPISSPTIITRENYLETGFPIAQRTISRIKGATATHFASGNCLPIADLVSQTGTAVVGVSSKEDLSQLKNNFKNKVTVLGNLNGIEMRRWTTEQTTNIVREAIQKAAPGGGFILSDNHGEIPFQVSDEVLKTISETVQEYGKYPIITSNGN
jgi:uroporphyrinogen decarboxylase